MRLIFYGELRRLFGESATIIADTIADAIEGFSRQQQAWPRDMHLAVVGHRTPESLLECPDVVHIMPALKGGGGKFTSIIIGAAMIAVAIALPQTALAWSIGIGISGATMILQGVMNLFMKSPTMGKNNDPDASKYIGLNKNTADVGTPITMAWGEIDLAGHWLSLQSDSNNLSHGVFPTNPT